MRIYLCMIIDVRLKTETKNDCYLTKKKTTKMCGFFNLSCWAPTAQFPNPLPSEKQKEKQKVIIIFVIIYLFCFDRRMQPIFFLRDRE